MNSNPPRHKHSLLLTAAVLALCLCANGCRTLDVRSSADKETDFSSFHTFNFAEPSTAPGQLPITAQNRSRLQSAVVAELAQRSLQLADKPALLFSIDLAAATNTYNRANPSVQSGSLGANLSAHYGLKYDQNVGSQPVINYTAGTLSFRASETKDNKLVWEGQAFGVLYQDRPDQEVQKRIHEAVEAVFKQFPIKPTK
jgi:hypothetical protein